METQNIVLIMVDQQRADMLGCYGHPIVKTPNIDALSRRGVRFSQAYCTCLPCSPSRASAFTGRYPHQHGVRGNSGTIFDGTPTLATVLKGAGYNIGYAGKWHVDSPRQPSDHGFLSRDCPDYGFPWDETTTDGLVKPVLPNPVSVAHYKDYAAEHSIPRPKMLAQHEREGFDRKLLYGLHSGGIETSFESMVCDHAAKLMDEFVREPETPFFIWANFWGPHRPHIIPEPYFSMYDPKSVTQDPAFNDDFAGKPDFHRSFAEKSGIFEYSWEKWQPVIATYWGYITMIDDLVGRLLGDLAKRGLLETTAVIFTADHGDMMGAHRQFEKGPTPYDQTWKVPFIAAHPECVSPGSVCDEFTYLHDILPTCAHIARSDLAAEPWQRDLTANITGLAEPLGRDSVYLQFYRQVIEQEQRILRTRDYKLVFNVGQLDELYDLKDDPEELTNQFQNSSYAGVRSQLQKRLFEHAQAIDDPIKAQLRR